MSRSESEPTTTRGVATSHHIAEPDVATVPRYVVDLDQPAMTRWNHVIQVYAGALRAVESQIDEVIERIAPTAATLVECMLSAASKTGVVYYSEELRAISAVSGVPLGKITAMQLVYEAAANCTSVITPPPSPSSPTPTGGDNSLANAPSPLAHIRTMDWEMPFLRPLTIEVEFIKGGTPVFLATTWVGYVGILTGVALRPNPVDNFSISINFRSIGSGTFWTNLKKTIGRSWPIGFLVREVLTDVSNFSHALPILENSSLIAPTYITLCGTSPTDGALLTRDREESEKLWLYAKDGPVVQVNMDHWSTDPNDSIMLSLQRRKIVRQKLQTLSTASTSAGRSPAKGGEDALWAMMSTSPVCNEITIYGTLMKPSEGYLETRLPRPYVGFKPITSARDESRTSISSHDDGSTAIAGGFKKCVRCEQVYDPALDARGQCAHSGTWHTQYKDCSYMKCGFGLGPSNIGKQHWSCCYNTEKDSTCKKSEKHTPLVG